MPDSLVIALGGNALMPPGHQMSIAEQRTTLRHSLAGVAELVRLGQRVVITHGNGPQVGHILLRSEAGRGIAYELPVDVAVAQSQGEMGYLIQQALRESLHRHGADRSVVSLVTQVVVERSDAHFHRPTKPVGPWFGETQVEELKKRGWSLTHDPHLGWRRLVPSPDPVRVVEMETIRKLYQDGTVVIAGGGGGIPVFQGAGVSLEGAEAVVDKDQTSATIAIEVGASRLVFLTGVEKVKLNLGRPDEQALDRLTVVDANRYLEAGQFEAGTMRPKIEAAIRFLEKGGKEVIITRPERVVPAWDGVTGTRISVDGKR